MFLKALVCIFSFLVLIKNISYSSYEYKSNKNVIGAICVAGLSIISFIFLNIVLFIIKF